MKANKENGKRRNCKDSGNALLEALLGSIPQLMTLMTRGKCLESLKEEEALMSETTSENAPTESQEGGGADDAEESSTVIDASEALTTALNLAPAVDQVRSMDTVASRDKRVDKEAPAVPHRPPVGRVRFNLNSDNQTRMVTSGNSSGFACAEDGDHDGHVHIHIVRTDIFNLSSYDIATRPSEQKTFGQWLTDNNHVEDHVMFLLSLIFCGSMIMTLTFAWIEIDTALANISWPFAVPRGPVDRHADLLLALGCNLRPLAVSKGILQMEGGTATPAFAPRGRETQGTAQRTAQAAQAAQAQAQ
ncbi:hypothetical protein MTO96_032331 [Rhipicephalus appendiculatus]